MPRLIVPDASSPRRVAVGQHAGRIAVPVCRRGQGPDLRPRPGLLGHLHAGLVRLLVQTCLQGLQVGGHLVFQIRLKQSKGL